MTFHIVVFLLVFFLILSLARLWHHGWLHLLPSPSQTEAVRTRVHRLLKPRTPLDCPSCRLACTPWPGVRPAPALVRPWSEVKSRRGAPKRIDTQGFACPNRTCLSFGITAAQIHPAFRGWQAWPCRADPDLSRSCLSHDVQCAAPHAVVPAENSLPADRRGSVFAGRRAGSFGCRAGLRLPPGHHHEPFSLVLGCTLKACTSASFARCICHISSWTNCAPGDGAPPRCCGCGWPLTPSPRSFPCLSLAPEHNTWHISSSTLSDNCWLPAAYRSSPVMAYMLLLCGSPPILDSGKKSGVMGAKPFDGWERRG
jgi:hypothetical protein